MRVTMLSTQDGSTNGVDISTFHAGREYDLPDGPSGLATNFLLMGWAKPVESGPPAKLDPPAAYETARLEAAVFAAIAGTPKLDEPAPAAPEAPPPAETEPPARQPKPKTTKKAAR